MGRCYEFGVSIREGCEHAMVVPADGGRCVCVSCDTACPGRFKGCVAVISQPGYVPVTAPAWSLHRDLSKDPAVPVGAPSIDEGRTGVASASHAEPASPAGSPSFDPDVVVALVEDLGKQIARRDAELGALFDRFVEEFQKLRDEVARQSESVALLRHRTDDVASRLDTIVSATLLGPLSRDA
jgi:hypothetical protein